jgi:hypothetical protein
VLAAQHLLGFRGVNLFFERGQRPREIGGHVFATVRPFEQDADVVEFLGEAVAQFEVLGEAALALERFLRLRLVIPEIRRGDFLFELS